jgi:ParB family chromosome partitioning protein
MVDNKPKQRLGRGLAALIGDMDQPQSDAPAPAAEIRSDRLVPIELIKPNPNNPRRQFSADSLNELAASIKEHGVVQPILVRPSQNNADNQHYELIAGERRWRAAQKAGVHEIPVVIREVEDKQALELAIIENVQRADLNQIEEALGYQQLIDEYKYDQSELAGIIGKSRPHVANTLRLLKLPPKVQKMLADGLISAGHARTLVGAENAEEIAQKIIDEGLSVRQAETLLQQGNTTSKKSNNPQSKDANTVALEQQLSEMLGLKVSISHKASGKGNIKIDYKTLEQLDDICERIKSK